MKRISIITAALIAAVSCQEIVIQDKTDGAIAVNLTNSPVVELVTKADDAVSTDDFNVYVASASGTTTYKYSAFPSPLNVPVGEYTLSADNITETESLTGWGAVRYATAAPVTKTVSTGTATVYTLNCAMVNTAVSVVFEGDFASYLSDYQVSVCVLDDEDRALVYNASNTTGDTPAIGYFKPSAKLKYSFTATDKNNVALNTVGGTYDIEAATHLQLTFKIKGGITGTIQPEIKVDATCTELEEEIEVDPTDIAVTK